MKRIVSIVLATLFMAGLLAGCQPTPEQDIVVGKDNDGWEEAKLDAQEAQDLDIPETWQAEFSGSDLDVVIDAEVDFMDVTAFPVYVTRGKNFTQDEADTMMNVFFGDAELYRLSGEVTKDMIEQSIQNYTEQLEASTRDYEAATDPAEKEGLEHEIEIYQQFIQDLIKEKESAPEANTRIEASRQIGFVEDEDIVNVYGQRVEFGDGGWKFIWTDSGRQKAESDGMVGIDGFVDMPDGRRGTFTLKNRISDTAKATFFFGSSVGFVLDEADADNNAAPISEEEAISMANDLLDKLGVKADMLRCEETYLVTDISVENGKLVEVREKNPRYYIYYSTALPNTRCVWFETSPFDTDSINEDNFQYPLYQESMYVEVYPDGKMGFYRENPFEVVSTESENNKLLLWDDVSSMIEKGLKMKNIYSTESNDNNRIVSRRLNVSKIVLSYMQIKKKDNLSERYYVPVWDVIGTMTLKFRDDYDPDNDEGGGYIVDENHERVSFENCSVLTINAIDGTIIERSLGY